MPQDQIKKKNDSFNCMKKKNSNKSKFGSSVANQITGIQNECAVDRTHRLQCSARDLLHMRISLVKKKKLHIYIYRHK